MHLAATANDPVALEKLATKDDLNALKVAVKDDLNALKAEVKDNLNALKVDLADLKVEVRSLEARMYRALWLQGGAIVGILTALRFLPI